MPDLWHRKPTTVEAKLLTKDTAEDISQWCGGQLVEEINPEDPSLKYVGINVPTLHGVARCSEGDYVVKGEGGDFWPCAASVFLKAYAPF